MATARASLLCSLLCSISGSVLAQSFTQTFGPLYAQDGVGAQQTASGFIVSSREFMPATSRYSAAQYATSSSGAIQSTTPLDLPVSAFLHDVVNAADGSAMLVGSVLTNDEVDHDGLIVKVLANGTVVWLNRPLLPGSQQYYGGAMLPDGGIVVCGTERVDHGHEVHVVRFNASGSLLWSHTEASDTDAEAHGITVSGNDILITGRQTSFSGGADVLLMRMSLDGAVHWTLASGGDGNEEGRAVIDIGAGAFISAGWTNSYGAFDTTSQRIPDHAYLIAFDLDGDTLWTETLGDTLFDRRCFAMERAANGDLLLSGERNSTIGTSDALLMRTNASGELQWERTIDTGKEERITHLLPLADGLVGTGWSFGPFGRQVLFIRRNDQGF